MMALAFTVIFLCCIVSTVLVIVFPPISHKKKVDTILVAPVDAQSSIDQEK